MISFQLAELAEWIGAELRGAGEIAIYGADTLDAATEDQLTFVDSLEHMHRWQRSPAKAAIVPQEWPSDPRPALALPAKEVRSAFARVVTRFRPPRDVAHGLHGVENSTRFPQARIAPSAKLMPGVYVGADVEIGEDCVLHPGVCVLDGCHIGPSTVIYPHAVLYENSIVGARCIIHAHAVIGAFGFGFRTQAGKHVAQEQLGYVHVEDDVEIGAGTAVDRGAFGATRIGAGTKIDNLVQIGHNCQIGKANLICAQVGVGGSSTTGDNVTAGGQAGIRDHAHIGQGAVLTARAAVSADVPEGAVMLGVPAFPYREATLQLAAIAKLPEMRKQFKELSKQVAALQSMIAAQEQAMNQHDRGAA